MIDLPENLAQLLVIRLVINIVNIDVLDDTFLINDEQGAFAVPFATQDAICRRDCAMRPEIGEQGKADPAQAFSPCLQAGNMIDADAQNLGIQSRELGLFSLVRRDLAASYRRPG